MEDRRHRQIRNRSRDLGLCDVEGKAPQSFRVPRIMQLSSANALSGAHASPDGAAGSPCDPSVGLPDRGESLPRMIRSEFLSFVGDAVLPGFVEPG